MPRNLPPDDWEEEGKWTSAAQAFVLISGFFALVFFGANLNFSRAPLQAAAAVSLIPAPSAPAPKPKPKPKPEVKKPEPKPAPKPEPKKPDAADIALKKKKEEEKKRKEAEAKKKREEDARKKREKEKREKEEREKEKERKERERLAREKREADAARRAALNRIKDSYIGRIIGSIEPSLTTPKNLTHLDDLEVVVEVNLHDDGTLNGFPTVAESSGYPEYDEAAVRAVLKASPLPLPPDPELRKEFLNLKLHITPE